MITSVKVFKKLTNIVSEKLKKEITFQHGNTLTVVNYITNLRKENKVYPAIILFTENLTETKKEFYYEFVIPKIAICTTTVEDATEKQRLESNFEKIIFPIFEELSKELMKIHADYNLFINRVDIPYFSNDKNENKFNQLVDGCLIKNLNLKIFEEQCKNLY